MVALGLAALTEGESDLAVLRGDLGDLLTSEDPFDLVIYDTLALAADRTGLRMALGQPHVRVLALTRDLRPGLTRTAVGLGVHGQVSLHAPAGEIVGAIREALAAHPAETVDLADGVDSELAALSGRERDVIELIAAGRSNQEVADTLFVTINSVKTYIRSAYRRIGITSRSQAVIWAVQHGIGPAPQPAPEATSEQPAPAGR